VVSVEAEAAAFQQEPEVADGAEGGEVFPVEGGVPQPSPPQLSGEEGEGAPRPAQALLEDGAVVCVGGVRGQRKDGVRGRVCEGNCGDRAALANRNAAAAAGVHSRVFGLPFRALVSGCRVLAMPGRNRL
jgi:hypothetical protein